MDVSKELEKVVFDYLELDAHLEGQTIIEYAFRRGMESQAKEMFTESEMYLFSGFLMGKKAIDPFIDVALVMLDWKQNCRSQAAEIVKLIEEEDNESRN
jgi:hypothetical protein